jgi:hypothetical protein
MSKGGSGLFNGTLGSTYSTPSQNEPSYTDRGIDIPAKIKDALSKLKSKGDHFSTQADEFSMKDISIMSKETGVEFAVVSAGNETFIIRGDTRGTDIPNSILNQIRKFGGTLNYHSHPINDDCIPSKSDRDVMSTLRRLTGQKTSTIVTPNGRTTVFNEHGVIETGTISNLIDKNSREIYLKLFGGK